eukprot:scpid74411/ scgid13755/ 
MGFWKLSSNIIIQPFLSPCLLLLCSETPGVSTTAKRAADSQDPAAEEDGDNAEEVKAIPVPAPKKKRLTSAKGKASKPTEASAVLNAVNIGFIKLRLDHY